MDLNLKRFVFAVGCILILFLPGRSQDLVNAVRTGQADLVRTLISKGANVNETDSLGASPLMWAVYNGDLKLAKFLVKKGADPLKKGIIVENPETGQYFGNLTGICVSKDKPDMLKWLIKDLKVPVDDRELYRADGSESGWTALQWAIYEGKRSFVDLLAGLGADLGYLAPADSSNALMEAIVAGQQGMARYLLSQPGIDWQRKNAAGFNALHYAVMAVDPELSEMLINKGFNVNEANDSLVRPLHISVSRNYLKLTALLVKHGADTTLMNKWGETPGFIARYYGYRGQQELLKGIKTVLQYPCYDTLVSRYTAAYNADQADSVYFYSDLLLKQCFREFYPENPKTGEAINYAGVGFSQTGQHEKALSCFRQALRHHDRYNAADTADRCTILRNILVTWTYDFPVYDSLQPFVNELIRDTRDFYGDTSAKHLEARRLKLFLLSKTTRSELLPEYIRLISYCDSVKCNQGAFYFEILNSLAVLYLNQDRAKEGLEVFARIEAVRKQGKLPRGFDYLNALVNVCTFLSSNEDWATLKPYLDFLRYYLRTTPGQTLNSVFKYQFIRAQYYSGVSMTDSAIYFFQKAVSLKDKMSDKDPNIFALAYLRLVNLGLEKKMVDETDAWLDTAIAYLRVIPAEELDPNLFINLQNIQASYYYFKEINKAYGLTEYLRQMALKAGDTSRLLVTMKTGFYCLYHLGKSGEAEELSLQIREIEKVFFRNNVKARLSFLAETAMFFENLNDTGRAVNAWKIFVREGAPLSVADSVALEGNRRIYAIRLNHGQKDVAYSWFRNVSTRLLASGAYDETGKKVMEQYLELLRERRRIQSADSFCRAWVEHYGKGPEDLSEYWQIEWGDVYYETGNHQRADSIYKALEIHKLRSTPADDPKMVLIYAKLGSNYYVANQYDLALPYYKKVIEIEEKNHASADDLKSYYQSMVRLYYAINDLNTAESFADKLHTLTIRDIKSDFETYLKARIDYIYLKVQLGKYDDAEVTANVLLEQVRKYPQFTLNSRIDLYQQLSFLFSETGNRQRCLQYMDSLSGILKNHRELPPAEWCRIQTHIGLLFTSQGNPREGLRRLKEVAGVMSGFESDTSGKYLDVINYLGLSYVSLNKTDSALMVWRQGWNAVRPLNRANSSVLNTLKYMQAIFALRGMKDSTVSYLRTAANLAGRNPKYLTDHLDFRIDLAGTYTTMGKPDSALAILNSVQARAGETGVSPDIAEKAGLEKGYALMKKGFTTEGAVLVNHYMEQVRGRILSEILYLSSAERENYLNAKITSFRSVNNYLIRHAAKAPESASIILDNELFMKGLALETNTRMFSQAGTAADPVQADLLDKVRIYKNKLERLYQAGGAGSPEALEISSRIDQYEKQLIKSTGVDFKRDYAGIHSADIRKNLGDKDLLVEFYSQETGSYMIRDTAWYYALVYRKSDLHPKLIRVTNTAELTTLFGAGSGNQNAQRLAVLYGERGARHTNKNLVSYKDMYSAVWKPVDSLTRGIQNVYIIPAGYLNKISFAAIKDTSGTYISERMNIHILSSSRQLMKPLKPEDRSRKSGLILGGIQYDPDSAAVSTGIPLASRSYTVSSDSTERSGFTYLPGTLEETNRIVSYLKGGKYSINYLTGKAAGEERFKESVRTQPYFIHIATHGFYLPPVERKSDLGNSGTTDNPLMRSGLILAGGNPAWTGKPIPAGQEDGILNAFEISNLDLRKTRLVVLSACETGLGDIKGAEGVYGLQRAFKLAGVEYIINSLWQVPDEQTSELMQLLYLNWSKGMSFENAFFSAQKAMKKKYEPYYWAAFQLVR